MTTLNNLLVEYSIKVTTVENLSVTFALFQLNKEEILKLNKDLEVLRDKIKNEVNKEFRECPIKK